MWLEDEPVISAIEDLVEKDLDGTYRPIQASIEKRSVLTIVTN